MNRRQRKEQEFRQRKNVEFDTLLRIQTSMSLGLPLTDDDQELMRDERIRASVLSLYGEVSSHFDEDVESEFDEADLDEYWATEQFYEIDETVEDLIEFGSNELLRHIPNVTIETSAMVILDNSKGVDVYSNKLDPEGSNFIPKFDDEISSFEFENTHAYETTPASVHYNAQMSSKVQFIRVHLAVDCMTTPLTPSWKLTTLRKRLHLMFPARGLKCYGHFRPYTLQSSAFNAVRLQYYGACARFLLRGWSMPKEVRLKAIIRIVQLMI